MRNIAHEDGSLTIDNASVQRLLDYGLLHYTNAGWIVGSWESACNAQGTEARRAQTGNTGSVHDGPVAKLCAQTGFDSTKD